MAKSGLWKLLVGTLALLPCTAYAWDFSLSTSGNSIVVHVFGMVGGRQTCSGASADLDISGRSCSVPGLSSRTHTLTCNRVGAHVVYVSVSDDTTPDGGETRTGTVTVTTPPPFSCPVFELMTTPRALTHKYGTEAWPRWQQRDAQVEVIFRPIRVDPGMAIYAKVFDPKDGATYRANASNDDNLDPDAGTLAFSPTETGTRNVVFSAGTEPLTTMYLNTTQYAAGDNYVVKASADPDLVNDPNFVCNAASGCVSTVTVTAWKRVYVEKKEMFRRGVSVARPAPAGSREVRVQVPAGLRWNDVALRQGDAIRLLHAPRFNGAELFREFYWEDAVVQDVRRVARRRDQRDLVLVDPLTHAYSDDPSLPVELPDRIGDGVGYLAAGTYRRNEAYLNATFDPAYVDFWPATERVSEVPYVPFVHVANWLANKWFENSPVSMTGSRRGNPNVKHVLAGSGVPDPDRATEISAAHFGETGIDLPDSADVLWHIPEPNYSWTWVAGIETAVSTRGNVMNGLDPWIFNGENLVHELAHTFNVNSLLHFGDDFGHCDRPMAGSPVIGCRMKSNTAPSFNPREAADGIVGFHYSSDLDSEYMTIRRAWEPLAIPAK